MISCHIVHAPHLPLWYLPSVFVQFKFSSYIEGGAEVLMNHYEMRYQSTAACDSSWHVIPSMIAGSKSPSYFFTKLEARRFSSDLVQHVLRNKHELVRRQVRKWIARRGEGRCSTIPLPRLWLVYVVVFLTKHPTGIGACMLYRWPTYVNYPSSIVFLQLFHFAAVWEWLISLFGFVLCCLHVQSLRINDETSISCEE